MTLIRRHLGALAARAVAVAVTVDGNADDVAGGNHGTLEGSATFGAGHVGQAFSFSGGGSSGVRMPDPVPRSRRSRVE